MWLMEVRLAMAKQWKKKLAKELKWQLRLPAGTDQDGNVVSLRDLLSPRTSSTASQDDSSDRTLIPFSDLSDEKKAKITAERIRQQESYSIVVPGRDVMGRDEAIKELKKAELSDVGRMLIDVEERMLGRLLELGPLMLAGE